MSSQKEPGCGGTGVFFPPAFQAALARGCTSTSAADPAPPQARSLRRIDNSKADAGPDSTPVSTPTSCSSRSSSFTSDSSSGCPAAGVLLKLPQHAAAAGQPRGPHSRPPHQLASTVRRTPFGARDLQETRPMSDATLTPGPACGRFSLDCRLPAMQEMPGSQQAAQQMLLDPSSMLQVEPSQGIWPAGTALCNSLSVPQLNNLLVPQLNNHHSTGVLQDDLSWTSTVSGDAYMVAPGAYGTCVAGAVPDHSQASYQQLLAQQQAQQRQQMLQAQDQQEELEMLLAQLGTSSAPTSHRLAAPACYQVTPADDLATANNHLQGLYGAPARRTAARRASMQLLPVSGVDVQARGVAARRASMQLLTIPTAEPLFENRSPSVPPPLQLQAQPMMCEDAAGAGAVDPNEAALEATLEATLQQLWAMKQDVARRKAASTSPSTGTLYSSTPSPLAGAAPNSAVAAAPLTSQLYQPTQTSAGNGLVGSVGSNNAYNGTHAALLPDPAACASGGLLPLAMASTNGCSMQARSSLDLALLSLPVAAVAAAASGVGPQHRSWGQTDVSNQSLASWLQQQPSTNGHGCSTGAGQGLSAPQAVLQEELQLLAAREAGLSGQANWQSWGLDGAGVLGLQCGLLQP